MTPTGRRPDDVPTRTFDWGSIKWLVTPHLDETAKMTLGEVIINSGQGHAPHTHPGEGDAIYIPLGTVHSTYNTTWRPLRLVVTYTPGGAETMLDELPDAHILEPGEVPAWLQSQGG